MRPGLRRGAGLSIVARLDGGENAAASGVGTHMLSKRNWRATAVVAVLGVASFGSAATVQAAGSYEIIYSFPNTNAANPAAGLYRGPGGALFGTTLTGGTATENCPNGCGVIFSLVPPNANRPTWTRMIQHVFAEAVDGSFPYSTLIRGKGGAIFGSTSLGGTHGAGTIFKLTPPASGTRWDFEVIYNLDPATSGSGIFGDLAVDVTGTIYAASYADGPSNCGTVFKLIPPGESQSNWTPQVIYGFGSMPQGCQPQGGLTIGEHGTLYGTATGGGKYNAGVVFQLKRGAGGMSYAYRVLHHFTGTMRDGNFPLGTMVLKDGALYGVTAGDGSTVKPGTIFRLMPPATVADPIDYQVIHLLKAGTEGFNMQTGLTVDANGIFYGVTYQKSGAQGGLFTLAPPPAGLNAWRFTTLHTLTGAPDGDDPTGTLMRDNTGTFYGTTQYGGAADHGSIFTYSPSP